MAINRLYSKQMKIDDLNEENNLTEEQEEELKKIQQEILDEAKKVVKDYSESPSEISGSTINIHQNSPVLDSDKDGNVLYSGSRWTHIIKTKI
tara:strand:+ start:327 stop:605 length:279 start_codon:yes stop_codon:yes gene_type:complete